MRIPSRWVLGILGTGLAIGMLTGAPVLAQSSSQPPSQAKPAKAAAAHWGWFVPKPSPEPTPKAAPKAPARPGQAAKKPEPERKTVSVGGATPGGRPSVTTTVTQTGTPGGVGARSERISIPGINGGSQNLVDQETQTVRINDHTTQTIKKIYGQDPSGNRQLIAIQKTDTTDLGGGKSQSKMSYSQIDADGQFNVTRRAVSKTVPTGPHSSKTSTTVYTPGTSGGFDPSQKIEEVNSSDKATEHSVKTVLAPDVNGQWVTNQKTVTVVSKQAKGQQTEEKTLYQPDANGNLTVAKRVVTRAWKAKDGKQHQEVSTYRTTQGGTLTSQGTPLTLMHRVYTVKTTRPNGTIETREQTEERSLVSPSQGMQVTGSVVSVAKPTNGEMKTQTTVFNDDGNGQLRQVNVFTGQAPKPAPAAKSGSKSANGKAPGKKPANNPSGTKKQNQKQ